MQTQCKVFSFDPTPAVMDFMRSLKRHRQLDASGPAEGEGWALEDESRRWENNGGFMMEQRWVFFPWGLVDQRTAMLGGDEDVGMLQPVAGFSDWQGNGDLDDQDLRQMLCLQDIMVRLGHERLHVVKMDIEGYEIDVLAGENRKRACGSHCPSLSLVFVYAAKCFKQGVSAGAGWR